MRSLFTVAVLMVASAIVVPCSSLQFDLLSTEKRCVYDILQNNMLATGTYQISSGDGDTRVQIVTRGPDGQEVSSIDNAESGKFAFVAHMEGEFQTCFTNRDMVSHSVSIKLRSGVEARDLSSIAQKDHLQPLALELVKLEEITREIRLEMLKRKVREKEMSETNETTNSRVKWFSLFSVFVVVSLGLWQIFYLQNYFAEKKII